MFPKRKLGTTQASLGIDAGALTLVIDEVEDLEPPKWEEDMHAEHEGEDKGEG